MQCVFSTIYVTISLCTGSHLGTIWYCRSRLHIFFFGIVSYHANESGCRRLDTGYLIFFSRDITNRIIGAYGVYDVGPLYLYYIMVCSGLGPALFFFSFFLFSLIGRLCRLPLLAGLPLFHWSARPSLRSHNLLLRSSHFTALATGGVIAKSSIFPS